MRANVDKKNLKARNKDAGDSRELLIHPTSKAITRTDVAVSVFMLTLAEHKLLN